jgi:NADH-quinone oxidoreductase subunit F
VEERRLLFAGIDTPDIDRHHVYLRHGGGDGLARARGLSRAAVVDEIEAAGLRGRGGAWRAVAPRWRDTAAGGDVIVDLLEPAPGRFRDRKLAERHPHRILEGARIAAHAVDAGAVVLCVAAEALRARESLARAIEETAGDSVTARLLPVRGPLPLAAGDSLAVSLTGGGRAEPFATPPPSLTGRPAVVHSATTIAFLPRLLASSGESLRGVGSTWAPGTQAFCVSGLVRRPGLYEVELGRGTWRDLVEVTAGGAREGRQIKFVLHDGYGSSPVLTGQDLDRPLDPGGWAQPAGGPCSGDFGGGAVIVADDTVCAVDTARRMAQTFLHAACGQCLACREGTRWLAQTLQQLEAGEGTDDDVERLQSRCAALTPDLALCGHAPSAARGIAALLAAFHTEFRAHVDGGCPVDKDLDLKVPESIHLRY